MDHYWRAYHYDNINKTSTATPTGELSTLLPGTSTTTTTRSPEKSSGTLNSANSEDSENGGDDDNGSNVTFALVGVCGMFGSFLIALIVWFTIKKKAKSTLESRAYVRSILGQKHSNDTTDNSASSITRDGALGGDISVAIKGVSQQEAIVPSPVSMVLPSPVKGSGNSSSRDCHIDISDGSDWVTTSGDDNG